MPASFYLFVISLVSIGLASCGPEKFQSWNSQLQPVDELAIEGRVVERYADIALDLLQLAHRDASEFSRLTKSFEKSPSRELFIRLQAQWGKASLSLAETAALILPGGQGQDFDRRIRAWPVSPSYLDATPQKSDEGLIVEADDITKSLLVSRHQYRYRFNACLGIYAMERMLFGPSAKEGVDRYEAFVTDSRAEQRRRYLRLASEIYAEDLKALSSSFNSKIAGSFASRMIKSDSKKVIRAMLKELRRVAADEIAAAQIRKPLEMRSEQFAVTRFSNSSVAHLTAKLEGWERLYMGSIKEVGPGVSELVALQNPQLDLQIKETLELARRNFRRLDKSFDSLVKESEGRAILSGQAELFERLGELISKASAELDIKI